MKGCRIILLTIALLLFTGCSSESNVRMEYDGFTYKIVKKSSTENPWYGKKWTEHALMVVLEVKEAPRQ